jgi:hypothetical protein
MGKYPTPSEARSHFETGVELAKEKYVSRAREGAVDFETWFTGFASKIYTLLQTLPDPAGLSIDERIDKRVKPVSKAIHELSLSYRAAKLKEIVKPLKVVV